MKRRNVLKKIGFGLSAGAVIPALPAWLTGCKTEDPIPEIHYDGVVAIIGAGAAGLYAGDILHSKGVNVKIFEASSKPGGRVKSLRLTDDAPVVTDFPIELGAERIMGTDSIWAEIVSQRNIPVVELDEAVDYYILDNLFKDPSSLQSDTDFQAAKSFYESMTTRSGSGSVLQAIQSSGINDRVHAILNSWIGNKRGTSNERLAVGGLSEEMNLISRNNRERILRSNTMQDMLASRFNAVIPFVDFNSVVKSVDYSSSRIKITGERVVEGSTTENFSFEADRVIVTVPVSVLKANAISFNPPLPSAKVNALSHLGMDASVRIILEFKQNFWANDCRFIYGGKEAPEYFASGIFRSEFNKTLSVTVSGAKAEEFSAAGKEAAVQSVLAELDGLFDGKASQNIRVDDEGNFITEYMDWTKQPHILGGVSFITPSGSIQDREVLSESVSDLVFFAGEATDNNGEAGTINGALLSAERAANEVVTSILEV